jgi:hypothetical protein
VAQLYPRALCSLLSPLTILRDFGGGILTRLHTGKLPSEFIGVSAVRTSQETFRLRNKAQPVNAVYGGNLTEHRYSVWYTWLPTYSTGLDHEAHCIGREQWHSWGPTGPNALALTAHQLLSV